MEKKYDACLFWEIATQCNLSCRYCYYKSASSKAPPAINIPLLINTIRRTGGTFLIDFTGGGEPFLIPDFILACEEITKDHFIRVNTNLTCQGVERFARSVNPDRVTLIRASCHIAELKRLDLVSAYVSNFKLLTGKGFNMAAAFVAEPSLAGEYSGIKGYFRERGIELETRPFDGEYEGRRYPAGYTKGELEAFGLNKDIIREYYRKGTWCNAGYNAGAVSADGNIKPCFVVDKDLGNIYSGIKFAAEPMICPVDFCPCPPPTVTPGLLKKATDDKKVK